MDTFNLRIATAADSKTVANLHIENWCKEYRGILTDWDWDGAIKEERTILWESRLSAIEDDKQYAVIAEVAGKAVGFACAMFVGKTKGGVCLDNLHVLSGFRRSGIGRALFAKVVQWAQTAGHDCPIHLWVFESNTQARSFYDKLGGKIIAVKEKEIVNGLVVSTCLYLWTELDALLHKLCGNG
jgi:GNAT superfamily N-acetyltransferase